MSQFISLFGYIALVAGFCTLFASPVHGFFLGAGGYGALMLATTLDMTAEELAKHGR